MPANVFLSAPGGHDEGTAKAVLEDIKRHMAFFDPVELKPLDVPSVEYNHTYQSLGEVAGTYLQGEGVSVIWYDPEEMHRPVQLINLLAHELMHARLSVLEGDVPGGYEAHELATELGCIIAGFGVFQLQAADDAGSSFFSSRCNRLLYRALKGLG